MNTEMFNFWYIEEKNAPLFPNIITNIFKRYIPLLSSLQESVLAQQLYDLRSVRFLTEIYDFGMF